MTVPSELREIAYPARKRLDVIAVSMFERTWFDSTLVSSLKVPARETYGGIR
jgi:hypothetical protein